MSRSATLALERETALEATHLASTLCLKVLSSGSGLGNITKSDNTPVTPTDYASQIVITLTIRKNFPDAIIVGEEDPTNLKGDQELCRKISEYVNLVLPQAVTPEEVPELVSIGCSDGNSDSFWTADPIDGTIGFISGGEFAVCIALIKKGEVVLGTLGCPVTALSGTARGPGCVQVAVKGEGAYQMPLNSDKEERIYVRNPETPSSSVLIRSFTNSNSLLKIQNGIIQGLGIASNPISMHSQCKYALVARGDADLYFRYSSKLLYCEKIWDHASGSFIVSEAGGTVTDLNGDKLNFSEGRTLCKNLGILASSGKFHQNMVEVIKSQNLL